MNLKEKLNFLKTHDLVFDNNTIDFFKTLDNLFEQIKADFYQFNELLELGKLNIMEFDLLKNTINNFKKSFEKLDRLVSRNNDRIELLKDIKDNAMGIIEEFRVVKDLDTSMWGDYVWDVKKDSLCAINSLKLIQLLNSLEKITSYTENKDAKNTLPKPISLINDLMNTLGMFESEFILNVVYRRPTEIMSKIGEIAREIDKNYSFYGRSIRDHYFKVSIEDCLTNIESLELKYLSSDNQIDKTEKIVKLLSLASPTKRTVELYRLRDVFKYGFKF